MRERRSFGKAIGIFILVGLSCGRGLAQGKGPVGVSVGVTGDATTWAVGQSLPVNTVVSSLAVGPGAAAPTGTVQLYANGQPLGTPVTLVPPISNAINPVAIQIPGSYAITAAYSGDANYAPATSSYLWPVTVEYNPPTMLPVSSPTSLNFTAGATTGNTLQITMQNIGCNCGGIWSTTIAAAPGTTASVTPPTLTFVEQPADVNGNSVYQVTIVSSAPRTVTVASHSRPGMARLIPVLMTCGLLPLFIRRRRRSSLGVPGMLMLLPLLGGCAAGSSPTTTASSTTTTIVPGSAGSYVVTVAGSAFTQTTYTYFSLQVPITIQ